MMVRTVYVAGASTELERAERAMNFVRRLGWEVAHDWVADVRRVREEGGREDDELTDAERREFAEADLYAVASADLLWLLSPTTASSGAWVEFGFFLARLDSSQDAPRLIVSGPTARYHIFCALACRVFDYETDAGEYLKGLQ
jgi:hypothetical protein